MPPLFPVFFLLIVLLLALNAFFVLAEFAAVKARPSQMDVLAARGNRKAKLMQHVQANLDEYLSVCQVGITLASIGLGFVGEPAFADLIKRLFTLLGLAQAGPAAVHATAITLGYLLVSYLHIVLGELLPKSIAIRSTERSALLIAYPLGFFRTLFIAPIWLLNSTVNVLLRLLRMPVKVRPETHSEDEIRVILNKSQLSSEVSFRRLLFIENILDMGGLTVRNAMRVRKDVQCLDTNLDVEEIRRITATWNYSRYPLLAGGDDAPVGYVHIKNLCAAERAGATGLRLDQLARPCLKARESDPLEPVLVEMQRKGNHIALVFDKGGRWSGIITLEDIVEEVIGTIEEEYPVEQSLKLGDVLSPDLVLLDVSGTSIASASRNALARVKKQLPGTVDEIARRIFERELRGSSYMGRGLAIPHARLESLARPLVIVARLKDAIPAWEDESIKYLFILLTPSNAPRLHQLILARVASIFESDFLVTRMDAARSAGELFNSIRTAEQTTDPLNVKL